MFFVTDAKRKTKAEQLNGSAVSIHRPPVAGERVDSSTAWRFSAFSACVRIKSETIAYLPWHVFERGGSKSKAINEHAVDSLLYRSPNPELAPFYFKELLVSQVEAHGNSYWEIVRNRFGQPVEIWNIENQRMQVKRNLSGRLIYEASNPGGGNITFQPKDILHVRGPSHDGIVGRSVIDTARESISLGLAANAFGSSFLGNGAMPALVISNPEGKSKLDEDGVKNMLATWNRRNQGASKANKTEYLDPGLKVEALGLTPEQTQFIQTADFTIIDMCRWFRIPPHKLAKLERATWNNIESQNTEFVTDAILPGCSRMEGSANHVFLNNEPELYTKMNVRGLLRGDSSARKEYYKDLQGMGVLNINDIREAEDMDEVEHGDTRLVPQNMTTLSRMVSGDYGKSTGQNSSFSGAVIQETAQRICKLEQNKIKKVGVHTSSDSLAKTYVEIAQIAVDAFRNIIGLVAEGLGKNINDPEAVLKDFFSELYANSADELMNAIYRGEEKALLNSWEKTKASRIAERVLLRIREVES